MPLQSLPGSLIKVAKARLASKQREDPILVHPRRVTLLFLQKRNLSERPELHVLSFGTPGTLPTKQNSYMPEAVVPRPGRKLRTVPVVMAPLDIAEPNGWNGFGQLASI